MRLQVRLLAAAVVAACWCTVAAYAADSAAPSIDPAKFHALLVGCTKYDNLPTGRTLRGPANDVDLVRRFFTDQLKLRAPSITVLSEPEATAHGAEFRPTRGNIEREIQKLIDTAQEGDQVVLVLAGHGGQQPERKDPDPNYLKPDGLDQMFLPCDCGHWNGKKHCVENAIVDYELRNWCKQITKKKARLWVVLDACCSGWTLRGDSTEVARSISTDELGIPEADIASAQEAAAARRPASRGAEPLHGDVSSEAAFDFGPQSPDYVGLYAAQRDESEMEMPMPRGDEVQVQKKVQGLLTYAIVDILSRASRPITYGELANLVRQRYPQWGRTTGPTPVMEGLAQNREVLGVERWPGRSSRQWQKDASGELAVNEGEVQGLTPGTVLALYPSVDQPDSKTLLGYAKVQDCGLLESTIKLAKHNDMKEPRKAALPDGGCFVVALTDYGSLRVKVGVDLKPVVIDSSAANDSNAELLRRIAAELKTAFADESSLCEFVDDARAAQWLVQSRDGTLILLSRDAAQIRGKLPPETPRFSIPNDQAAATIVPNMTRIARAQNLLNLTTAQQANGNDDSRPNVELTILRYKNKADRQGTEVDMTKGPLELASGDRIGWRMTNRGKSDAAVSLLYIDAGFGITAIYPRAGSGVENMLTKSGGTFSTKPATITANPAGNEHVVLIAVPRQPEHQSPDFSFLEQESLPMARGPGDPDNSGLESPLGQLLKNAMYGKGGTRGMDSSDTAESQLTLQSWKVKSDTAP